MISSAWLGDSIIPKTPEALATAIFHFAGETEIDEDTVEDLLPSEIYLKIQRTLRDLDLTSWEIRPFCSPGDVPAEKGGGFGYVLFENGEFHSEHYLCHNAHETRHPLEGTGSPGDPRL